MLPRFASLLCEFPGFISQGGLGDLEVLVGHHDETDVEHPTRYLLEVDAVLPKKRKDFVMLTRRQIAQLDEMSHAAPGSA
jgi:hypothetical protein